MQRRRPTALIGIVLVVCGAVMLVVGGVSNGNTPAGDADIGAGAWFVGGMVVVLVGLVVWAVQGVLAQRRAARSQGR